MTLVLAASTTLGINGSFRDSCPNINTNSIVFIETQTPSIRVLNASTLAFMLSSTTLANPAGVSMINAASAIIPSTSATTIDLIEIATGFRQNYSGGLATFSKATGGQVVAGDPTTNIAFITSNTARTLVRFNGNNFTVSQPTLENADPNSIPRSIINIGPGRWLIGTSVNEIFEIDQNSNILDNFSLRLATFPLGTSPDSGSFAIPVNLMSYDNNLLLIETGGGTMLLDWSTKSILKTFQPEGNSSVPSFLFCNSSSGETILAPFPAPPASVIYEFDLTISPLSVRSMYYVAGGNEIISVGMNAFGYVWCADNNNPVSLKSFTVTPRNSTTRNITVMNTTGGVNQQARLILVDDTSGAGFSNVILDTYMNSPATYRIPTGKTLMEIVKVGLGSTATWDVTRYNT
jgi:hypothetical protein